MRALTLFCLWRSAPRLIFIFCLGGTTPQKKRRASGKRATCSNTTRKNEKHAKFCPFLFGRSQAGCPRQRGKFSENEMRSHMETETSILGFCIASLRLLLGSLELDSHCASLSHSPLTRHAASPCPRPHEYYGALPYPIAVIMPMVSSASASLAGTLGRAPLASWIA